jgi:hypothetical protein
MLKLVVNGWSLEKEEGMGGLSLYKWFTGNLEA